MSRVSDPPSRRLMPWPRSVRWFPGAGIAHGTLLRREFSGVTTPRLARALTRWESARQALADSGVAANGLDSATTLPLTVRCERASAEWPALNDDESFSLTIDASGITLSSTEEWGALRSLAVLQTLLNDDGSLPFCAIDDAPRFPWRGLMLDVARHFLPLTDLLRTVDAMALFRLNVLHLHLTDDQGFRFPSRTYPALASAAAYAREELTTLIQYAADRGIRVVPELDIPGHTNSWLDAYPDWGTGYEGPSRRFGVHRSCLNPIHPRVLEAVDTLLGEVAEIFPDAYLHFGGDEVHATTWPEDPVLRAHMDATGMRAASDLQAAFNARVIARISALGRRPMGWDEVLHPRLPAGVTVQAWRGATARDRALAAGCDCIVSSNYYLDLFFPADVHYRFDPAATEDTLIALEDALGDDPRLAHVAAGMRWTRHWRHAEPGKNVSQPGRLLGGSACLWSELVDSATLDVRLWTRLPALAERFWSPDQITDVADMQARLSSSRRLLTRMGIDLVARRDQLLERAGLAPAWWPLVEQLEPVKWYGRLLGAQALAARIAGREMPLARPYHADTPLDRVVDALPPEAFGAGGLRALAAQALSNPAAAATFRGTLADESARSALSALALSWRDLPRYGAPAELEPLAQSLIEVGGIVLNLLEGRLTDAEAHIALAANAQPQGEYLLSCVPILMSAIAGQLTVSHG
ncbi:MAG: beta-N-acetylhexosaminidase [Pseudomonadales bacterium]